MLVDEGLATAIEALAEAGHVPIAIDSLPDERFPPAVEAAAYFLVAEVVKREQLRRGSPCAPAASDGRLLVEIDSAGTLDDDLVDLEDRIGALDGDAHGRARAARSRDRSRGDPVRIVIADDEMLMREGLARLLADAGFDVVGKVADGAGAPARGPAHRAGRRDRRHQDAADPYRRRARRGAGDPRRRIPASACSSSRTTSSRVYAMRLLEEHPERVGYLLKERVSDIAVLADALRRIAEGECVLDPTIVTRLAQSAARRRARSTS